jgi:hypothetical protein
VKGFKRPVLQILLPMRRDSREGLDRRVFYVSHHCPDRIGADGREAVPLFDCETDEANAPRTIRQKGAS